MHSALTLRRNRSARFRRPEASRGGYRTDRTGTALAGNAGQPLTVDLLPRIDLEISGLDRNPIPRTTYAQWSAQQHRMGLPVLSVGQWMVDGGQRERRHFVYLVLVKAASGGAT